MTATLHENPTAFPTEAAIGGSQVQPYAVDPAGYELIAGSYDTGVLPGAKLDNAADNVGVLDEVEIATLARNAFDQQLPALEREFPRPLIDKVGKKLTQVHSEALVKSVPPVTAENTPAVVAEPDQRKLSLDELDKLADRDEEDARRRELYEPEDTAFLPVHEERYTDATKHPTRLTGRELRVAEAAVVRAIPQEDLVQAVSASLEARRALPSKFVKAAGVLAITPIVLLSSLRHR